MFVGFLYDAGLRHGPLAVRVENGRSRWTGIHPVNATVRLVITLADGSQQATSSAFRSSPAGADCISESPADDRGDPAPYLVTEG